MRPSPGPLPLLLAFSASMSSLSSFDLRTHHRSNALDHHGSSPDPLSLSIWPNPGVFMIKTSLCGASKKDLCVVSPPFSLWLPQPAFLSAPGIMCPSLSRATFSFCLELSFPPCSLLTLSFRYQLSFHFGSKKILWLPWAGQILSFQTSYYHIPPFTAQVFSRVYVRALGGQKHVSLTHCCVTSLLFFWVLNYLQLTCGQDRKTNHMPLVGYGCSQPVCPQSELAQKMGVIAPKDSRHQLSTGWWGKSEEGEVSPRALSMVEGVVLGFRGASCSELGWHLNPSCGWQCVLVGSVQSSWVLRVVWNRLEGGGSSLRAIGSAWMLEMILNSNHL